MSQVLMPQKAELSQNKNIKGKATPTTGAKENLTTDVSVDFDGFSTSSSLLEFLNDPDCCNDVDTESIFEEVSRLADKSDTRSVDELLREAELLINQRTFYGSSTQSDNANASQRKIIKQPNQNIKLNTKYTKNIENVRPPPHMSTKLLNGHTKSPSPPVPKINAKTKDNKISVNGTSSAVQTNSALPTPTPTSTSGCPGDGHNFAAFVDNLPSESILSEESTPKDMDNVTVAATDADVTTALLNDGDDTEDGTDTLEEITEGMETIAIDGIRPKSTTNKKSKVNNATKSNITSKTNIYSSSSMPSTTSSAKSSGRTSRSKNSLFIGHHSSLDDEPIHNRQQHQSYLPSRVSVNLNANHGGGISSCNERRNSGSGRRSSITTPDSGISQMHSIPCSSKTCSNNTTAAAPLKSYCDKSANCSPKHYISTLTSPIEPTNAVSREHMLKHEIELLQEKLKDTEERLQSLRIQHDSLSQLHRDLRESNTHLQDESEILKLDVQHLNECANFLRAELQAARNDRKEAMELQKALQVELDESRKEKKRVQEQKDKDSKTIQDLQRQCREMERILMRKHPDSVSALIVAAKHPGKCGEDSASRKLLEQRIAQLESDAKDQDLKAQKILANVQARFNSVQSKYETHIADLETQVLSLQEINTKLNEKIESQVRTLDYFVAKKADKYYNNCTQTDDTNTAKPSTSSATLGTQTIVFAKRDHGTNTIGSSQHSASSSTSSTANSTPNNSRPSSKQSGIRKPTATATGGVLSSMVSSKLPISQSDSTISLTAVQAAAKEDAHLLATIRGMRVDLAVRDKALQRLTRELEECKKTIKKLQKEKDALKISSTPSYGANTRRTFDPMSYSSDYTPANTETQALKEAQNKYKLLEADYKSLHEKRLQDLKTLQTAHERELASCHETVRVLQQRLNERDEACANQKRRKVPVDYYALKAKVNVRK